MLTYPAINPILLNIGPLHIKWYGLMYLLGFFGAWRLGVQRARRPDSGWTEEQVSDLIFYGAMGVVLGGRIGYMLFYEWPELVAQPLSLFKVWLGGMSFHGGLIGVLLAFYLYSRKPR